MREKKFTPVPWERGGQVHPGIATFDNGQYNIYPPLGEAGPIAEVGGKANADLISAAPELLEALEFQCLRCRADIAKHNALSEDKQDADCGDCVCGRAIAKAYGETP